MLSAYSASHSPCSLQLPLLHALVDLAQSGKKFVRDGVIELLYQQAIKLPASYTLTFPNLRQDMSKDEFNSVIKIFSS